MKHSKKGGWLLRKQNRQKIILCIRTRGAMSRAEIAGVTGLGTTCVYDTCKELLAEGVLMPVGTVAGPRGRSVQLLEVSPRSAPVAGVRIAPEMIEVAVATPNFDILARRILPRDPQRDSPEVVVDQIAETVHRCATAADTQVDLLAGVGVTVSGMVNLTLGIIENMSNRPGWTDVPVTRMLESSLNVPVIADNCVRAAGLAHQWFAAEPRHGASLYILVADGIGASLLYNKDFVRGIKQSGVLFGHQVIDANGPKCPCGKTGCLEAFSSDVSYIRQMWPELARIPADISTEERENLVQRALTLARQGDPKATNIYSSVVKHLSIGVANGISLFGPQTVLISGTMMDASTGVIDDIRRETLQYLWSDDQGVEIRAIPGQREFLMAGAIGLVLCEPYLSLQRDALSEGHCEGLRGGVRCL